MQHPSKINKVTTITYYYYHLYLALLQEYILSVTSICFSNFGAFLVADPTGLGLAVLINSKW